MSAVKPAGILGPVAEKFAAFALEHALPLVVRHLPDVARVLAAHEGDLSEPVREAVRRVLPVESESAKALREMR